MLLPHINLFQKTKRGLEQVSLSHFLHDSLINKFILLYTNAWPNFIAWLPLFCEILHNCNCLLTRFWTLELIISFLTKPKWPKLQDKNWNILKRKRAFKIQYKAFLIIFKLLWLKEKKQFFLEDEKIRLKIRPYICIYIYICNIYINIYICIYIYIYISVYICVHPYICVYVNIHIYIHIYIYIYIYIYRANFLYGI